VYESNARAISVYERNGFQKTRTNPISNDNGHPPYFIMSINVSVAA
jgi:ribosomal protein S18 acetylase RimI-like enzyme